MKQCVGNVSMQTRCVLTHVPLQQAIKKKKVMEGTWLEATGSAKCSLLASSVSK